MSEALKNSKRLLPESEKEGVECHFTMTSGAPDNNIIDYVNAHRDVVLTIYDLPGKGGWRRGLAAKETPVFRKIKKALSIPLVVVKQLRCFWPATALLIPPGMAFKKSQTAARIPRTVLGLPGYHSPLRLPATGRQPYILFPPSDFQDGVECPLPI